MSKFSVAITANRSLDLDDHVTIFNKMAELVTNENIEKIYIGGAVGGDTVALQAALDISKSTMYRPKFIVVVPDTLKRQVSSTWPISKQADEIIELNEAITAENGYEAYHIRNRYMVDHAEQVVAFHSADKAGGGTLKTIRYAQLCGKPVDIIYLIGG